jgi:tubulin-specific chaperone E
MATSAKIGDRLSYDGALCTVRYVGEVASTSGSWIGVEWDDGTRGKHDGSHKGTRYFSCKLAHTTLLYLSKATALF